MRGRRTSRIVAAAATFGLCAAALGAPPAGAAVSTTTLTMSCDLAAIAPTPVSTTISAQLPETVPVGPATVSAFAVTMTLPETAIATLRGGGATTVGATFTAAMTASWGQEPHDIAIPPLMATDVPLPDTGDLTLTATADVPPLDLPVLGPVAIAVPQVITALSVHKGETSSDLPCLQDPGQNGDIGTITVVAADPGSSTTPPTTSGSEPPADSSTPGVSTPSTAGTTDPKHPEAAPDADDPPPGDVGDFDDICNPDPTAPGNIPAGKAWYKIDGPIHLLKLGSDLPVPLSDLVGNAVLNFVSGDGGHACIDGSVTVPDAPGYFVMFNFAPVTAIAHTMPHAKSRTKIRTGYLTSRTEAQIRLSDVKVNGVPLDVGPNCHTTDLAVIRLAGPYQGFTSSGTVAGIVDLPAFSGCAHDTDVVNPLFNGLVAGDGNPITAHITYKCLYLTCNGVQLPQGVSGTK
jgi:uncharacterized protein DUF6801